MYSRKMTEPTSTFGLPALPSAEPQTVILSPLPASPTGKQTMQEILEHYDSTDVAVRTLLDVAKNGATDSARVAASNALLEREHGKAMQGTVEIGEGANKISVSWV